MKRLVIATSLLVFASGAFASEGMWTPDNLPKGELKTKFKFEPTPA